MTENKHRCPLQTWESFDEAGKVRFNNVLDKTINRQKEIIHPMAIPMPDLYWQEICYQFACIAAWNDWHREYKSDRGEVFTAIDKLSRLGYSKQ